MLKDGEIIDPTIVTDFEDEFGIRLPRSYVDLVLENDGGAVEGREIEHVDPRNGLPDPITCNAFIAFATTEEGDWTMREANVDTIRPEGVISFAEEGGGRVFCFDYRPDRTTQDPPVVVFQPEYPEGQEIIPVASNFDGFVEMITSPPENTPS